MKTELFKRKNKRKESMSDKTFNTILLVVLTIFMLIMLYPIIFVVSSSFSSGTAIITGRVFLWPVDFSLQGYKLVAATKTVWTGYANTIFYTVFGTIVNMVLTILVSYPLSRRNFQGKGFFTLYYLIPMYFGGGIIPQYIVMSNLGLVNTRIILIVNAAISFSYSIMLRTAFRSVPQELLESAKMDGISDMAYLMKIVLPLSKATLSVITLYYMVGHWNQYFSAMIYLRDRDLFPLQIILKDILITAQGINAEDIMDEELAQQMQRIAETMRYALVVVSTVPMIVLYGFVQKFFAKGVMMGSVKG